MSEHAPVCQVQFIGGLRVLVDYERLIVRVGRVASVKDDPYAVEDLGNGFLLWRNALGGVAEVEIICPEARGEMDATEAGA